jgi:hypothetical protein
MDNSQIRYRSTNPNIVQPTSVGRRKFPLRTDAWFASKAAVNLSVQEAAYAFDVEFSCLIDALGNNVGGAATIFPPVTLNVPANNAIVNMPAGATANDPNAILTALSQPGDLGGGLGSFTGTFNIVPASWDDLQTQEWTPPGWIGSLLGATTYSARNKVPDQYTVRLHHDYFVVDPNGLATGVLDSGGNAINIVTSKEAIPIIKRTFFCNTLINSINPPATSPQPIYTSDTDNSLTPSGGYNNQYAETFPNIQAYQVWIANVQAIVAAGGNPWTGLAWDGGNGRYSATGEAVWPYLDQNQAQITQLVIKTSDLKDYAGSIIDRVTTYALAA